MSRKSIVKISIMLFLTVAFVPINSIGFMTPFAFWKKQSSGGGWGPMDWNDVNETGTSSCSLPNAMITDNITVSGSGTLWISVGSIFLAASYSTNNGGAWTGITPGSGVGVSVTNGSTIRLRGSLCDFQTDSFTIKDTNSSGSTIDTSTFFYTCTGGAC
jgi:hypothetical protein